MITQAMDLFSYRPFVNAHICPRGRGLPRRARSVSPALGRKWAHTFGGGSSSFSGAIQPLGAQVPSDRACDLRLLVIPYEHGGQIDGSRKQARLPGVQHLIS
jgi:hypothetical protein